MTAAGVGIRPQSVEPLESLARAATVQRLAPLLAAVLVFGVAAWAIAPYPVGIFHDDGVYLILAKALATGNGYRYLHLPGAPLATHYPPVYPALLALLWTIAPNFPGNLSLLLLVNTALLAFTAWALARFAHSRLGWPLWTSCVLAVVGTLSLPLLMLSTLVMSEVLCLALAVPLLAASEGMMADDAHRPRRAASLGAAAGVLVLVRTQSLALPLAIVVLLLMRQRWSRAAWYALGAAVVVVPWQLWVALHDAALAGPLHGSYGSYAGWYVAGLAAGGVPFVWHTVATNTMEIASLLADRIAPWPPGWSRILPLLVGLALLVAGVVRLRRRAPVLLTFLGFYFAVTLAWPYSPWRFVWAVWPLVLLLIAEGGWSSIDRARRSGSLAWQSLPAAAVVLLASGIARAELGAYEVRAWRVPVQLAQRQIAPVVRWAAMHTAPNDILLADDEPLIYLMTGRRALPPATFTALEYVGAPRFGDSTAVHTLRELLARYQASYVLTVVPATRDAARSLGGSAHRPALLQVQELGGTGGVFQVLR